MSKKSRKSVGVRDLKNHLSAYLKEVKQGSDFLVTEHGAVIAELRGAPHSQDVENPIISSWISEGIVEPPRQGVRKKVGSSSVTLPPGTAQILLDGERGE
jgi:antitoxin (DNA-binding transcriptional repressor) of toxin-antitoxin stability system